MSGRRRESTTGTTQTTLTTSPPIPFDFAGTAYSNGWAVLAPNRWDSDHYILRRTERLGPGRVVYLSVTGDGSVHRPRVRIEVTHEGDLQASERVAVRRAVRRMFRLDEDLAPFHALCRTAGSRWEPASRGLGRLLRSPTLFEDAVKTICTTNVQWGGTKAMVRRLVENLGEPGPLARSTVETEMRISIPGQDPNAFPTPEAIAAASGNTLVAARLGYRAPFIRELAERVASGELDLEELRRPELATEDVKRRFLAIKGVGAYAAATLLMLVGRYDHLAVDSVYRAFVTERYFGGERPQDREAERVYDAWGEWKYLGFWYDLWQGPEEDL